MTTDLSSLIERIEAGESGNGLDVLIEIALFRPDRFYRAVRSNAAGTKVIYTSMNGHESTHRADDWTMQDRRKSTLAALKARNPSHEG